MKEIEPARLATAEAAAGEAEKLMAELDADHSELERKVSLVELKIKSCQEKIDKHKGQMLSAATNKEYQSLLKEISLEEVEKGRIEEQQLEIMIKIESYAEREKQVRAKIEEAKSLVEETRKNVHAALDEISRDEAKALKERAAVTGNLEAEVLKLYEGLFASRNGEAVVEAAYRAGRATAEGRYLCTGCNMPLTHQMVNLLLLGREIVTCKSCGRILHLVPEGENSEES
jgi:predicted  nucleic acid-binding Zn-ribbon protein